MSYYLLGTVDVPEEKRKELTEKVLMIMYRAGLRYVDTEHYTADKPKIDKNGIVTVNYSIFEKRIWENATFNTHTCELTCQESGGAGMRLALNMVLLLIESYSGGTCIAMNENDQMVVGGYIEIISQLLREHFDLPNRKYGWSMLCTLHKHGKDMSWNDWMRAYGWYAESVSLIESHALFSYNEDGYFPHEITEEIQKTMNKLCVRDILDRKSSYKAECVGLLLDKLQKTKGLEYTWRFLQSLMASPYDKRKEIADKEDSEGLLAAYSMVYLPPIFISAYAGLNKLKFWDVYDRLNFPLYKDVRVENDLIKNEKEKPPFCFHEALLRDNEDDFLEYWNGENLVISDCMKKTIREWKEKYDSLSSDNLKNEDFEKLLFFLQCVYPTSHNARYFDKDMLIEFSEHISEPEYERAVLLMDWYVKKDIELFPELPTNRALSEIIKPNRTRFDHTTISALVSLMANKEQRKNVFGF